MSRPVRRLLVAAAATVDAFGNDVILIEYADKGRRTACSPYGGTLSIVQRDVDVSVPGDPGYVRTTC